MSDRFARAALLLGEDALKNLEHRAVAVFGLGGVGSFAAEALARSGVGEFLLVDFDTVDVTNINRQLHATSDSVGQYKTELMKSRILSINPAARILVRAEFCSPENVSELLPERCDYILDAVDAVSAKLALIQEAKHRGIPVISAMGAGNKLDPTRFKAADISKTSVCPLCRVMRREINKRGLAPVRVVFSDEPPVKRDDGVPKHGGRAVVGSVVFATASAGLVMAAEVVRDLTAVDIAGRS